MILIPGVLQLLILKTLLVKSGLGIFLKLPGSKSFFPSPVKSINPKEVSCISSSYRSHDGSALKKPNQPFLVPDRPIYSTNKYQAGPVKNSMYSLSSQSMPCLCSMSHQHAVRISQSYSCHGQILQSFSFDLNSNGLFKDKDEGVVFTY